MNTNYGLIKSELKVLGNILDGQKLNMKDGHFITSKTVGLYSRLERYVTSQNQQNTIQGLQNLVERIKTFVANGISEKQNLKLGVLIKNAEVGLSRLKVTYQNKPSEDMDRVIAEFNRLLPRETLINEDEFVIVTQNNQNLENLENQLKSMLNPKTVAAEISNPLSPVLLQDLKMILKKSFNDSLVDEMVEIYKLSDVVTPKEVNALLVGMMANLTYQDIQQIIEKGEGLAYNKIKDIVENGQITEEKLLDIVEKLRDVRILNPKHFQDYPHLAAQYSADRGLLVDCKINNAYELKITDHMIKNVYGNAEHLSRGYVYDLFETEGHVFREGVLIPTYEDGEKCCRQVNKIYNQDAIMAMGVSSIKELSNSKKIQVVFRGTYDLQSVKRDFDIRENTGYYRGPGHVSYKQHEENLLNSFNKFFAENADATDLEIMGHSLGSTDAQRFLLTLSEDMVANNDKWTEIKNIKLFGFNPPGVSSEDAEKFYENVKILESKNFDVNYLSTHGDLVHMFGSQLLGCSNNIEEKANNISRTFVRFHFPGVTHGNFLQEDVFGGQSLAITNNTLVKAGDRSYKAHSMRYFIPNSKNSKGTAHYNLPKLYAFGTDNEGNQNLKDSFFRDQPGSIENSETNNLDLALMNSYELYKEMLPKRTYELTSEDIALQEEADRLAEIKEQQKMLA